jgi:hypothetical protein
MTTVPVQLVNMTDHDIQVGGGTSLVVAKARAITNTALDNRGFSVWNFLAQGVAIIPGDIPLGRIWANQLAHMWIEQPTEEHDTLATTEDDDEAPASESPPSKPRRRRTTSTAKAKD